MVFGRLVSDCLNESDIKSCEGLLAKTLPRHIKRLKESLQKNLDSGDKVRAGWSQRDLDKVSGPSPILQYALSIPPYTPLYDLKSTKEFIQSRKRNIAILRSGNEREMIRVIGVPFRSKALEERLADDEVFLCMANVRLAQLQGKPAPALRNTN